MSVPQVNSYNKYQGNGVTTEFSVGFPYNNKSDVKVYLRRLNDVQQVLEENADYEWINDTTIRFPAILTRTVEIDGEEVEEQYTVQDVLEEGDILAIYRETPIASDYNFENQKRLFPEEVTHSDDLGIMLIQELSAIFSRTLTVDETSPVTPEELVNDLNTLVERAEEYAGQALSSADLAQAWAIKTDGPVADGEYSSKYYAEQILPMASDIITVAGNTTNINKVANDINRVGLVADDISSVHTVAIDISNVIDVAANIADINTAAANITDIQNASANALLAKNWAIKMDGTVEGSDYSAKYNAKLAQTAAEEASQSAALVKTNLPLLYHFWSDHKINDVCYLRGDTFSWQSGNVYRRAFEHLADDLLMNRPYIIPVNGFSTKFFRDPENDTETQFAWTQGFSILYTDKDYPASGDPIYYVGSVVDDVDEFAFGSGEYIITSLSADNKYYREADEDDSVNGYYAWMFNSSTKVYTTSATPAESDAIYTKSGGTYTSAGTVASVLLGPASSTETVSGHTITYYTAEDGHKIVLASQESTVLDIYNSTGVAWYYIFDEENVRFKLPRTKFGFTGLRDTVGKYVPETLPNASGHFLLVAGASIDEASLSGVFSMPVKNKTATQTGGAYASTGPVEFNLSGSSSAYQDSAPVQQRATQMYLYFFVGNFTQTPNEQQVGEIFEELNGKADRNLSNISATSGLRRLVEIYKNGFDWYKVYDEYDPSDGSFVGKWCEQGGKTGTLPANATLQIDLLKTYTDTNYQIMLTSFYNGTGDSFNENQWVYSVDADSFKIYNSAVAIGNLYWQTSGYIS